MCSSSICCFDRTALFQHFMISWSWHIDRFHPIRSIRFSINFCSPFVESIVRRSITNFTYQSRFSFFSHGLHLITAHVLEKLKKKKTSFQWKNKKKKRCTATLDQLLHIWGGIWCTDYLTPFLRTFLIIFNVDITAMGQRWCGFHDGMGEWVGGTVGGWHWWLNKPCRHVAG